MDKMNSISKRSDIIIALFSPMFVTWKKKDELRGCIGTFNPLPLSTGLREFAIKSAFEDTRFDPISHDELPHLECGVSLLHNFRSERSWDDWKIGVEGVQAKWKGDTGRFHTATFLPEVASEQEWDHLDTMKALVRKAGQKWDKSLLEEISLTSYESSKAHSTYLEYKETT